MDGLLNPEFPSLCYVSLISAASMDASHFILSLLRSALESLDRAYSLSPQRRAAYHIKAHNPRTLVTIFGPLTFTRTVYVDKHDSSHFFTYLDHVLGIPKYIHYDVYLRAMLIEQYLNVSSMAKSGSIVGSQIGGNPICCRSSCKAIPRQTVAYIINRLPSYQVPLVQKESTPETLYIMADEKYISLQNELREDGRAKKTMIKMAVVFEGLQKLHGQYRLIRPHYIIGYKQSFWMDALDELCELYDFASLKNIILMGDGAPWIKSGRAELATGDTSAVFLLDKFHTMQAVRHISVKYEDALRYYVQNDMKEDFRLMVRMIKAQYNEQRCEKIDEKSAYLLRNWEAIQYMYQKAEFGCSMESHIQHILASRLSEVPRAFRRENLEKLVRLIEYYENQQDIAELYLKGLSRTREGVADLRGCLDMSIFERKSDTCDRSSSSRAIARMINAVSTGKYH